MTNNGEKDGFENDEKLRRKNSAVKNPLVTQNKWENEKTVGGNGNNFGSIDQSSEGNNDSFVHGRGVAHIPKPSNTNNRRQQQQRR